MKYIFILIVIQSILFAQGEFINNKKSGIYAHISFPMNNDIQGFGGNIGISVAGIVDMGFEHVEYDGKVNASASLGYLGYNIKRDSSLTNLKILAGYYRNSINRVSGVLLSLVLSIRVYKDEIITLLPTIGLTYGLSSFTKRGYSGRSTSYDNSRSITLEFDILSNIFKGLHLILAPSLSKELLKGSNVTYVGLNGGVMVTFSNKVK